MKKALVVFLCLTMALVIGAVPPGTATAAGSPGLPPVLSPYLQKPTADGMTICLLAQGAQRVRVAWAANAAAVLTEVAASGMVIPGTPWTIWKTRLAQLERGTLYQYQVRYELPQGSKASPVYHFRTLDPQAKALRFAVFNDLHNRDQTLAALLRHVQPEDYEFSLLLGDCIADPSAAKGAGEVFRTWNAYLKLLDASNKPIIMVRGNHETRQDFAGRLALLFELPNLDATQQPDARQWQFTLCAGPVQLLAMDVGEDDNATTPEKSYKRPKYWPTYRQRQAQWLPGHVVAKTAAAAPWQLFVSHIPLYNSSTWFSASARHYWEPVLKDARLDLMLSGHDHDWRQLRQGRNGNPWPVLIGGGPSLNEGTVMLVAADDSTLHARMLAARDGRLLTEFVSARGQAVPGPTPGGPGVLPPAARAAGGAGDTFANDPTARTWLPVAAAAPVSATPSTACAAALLKPLGGQMRLLGCWYNGAELAASRTFGNGVLDTAASRWTSEVSATPVGDEREALDLAITFKLAEGVAKSAGVAVAFDFANWSTDNYVLIPASVYNGNRNRINGRGYNQGLDRSDLYRQELPLTHGETPRLALNVAERSKLEVSACNVATPAICFFSPAAKRGFIVLAEQGIPGADGGIIDNVFAVEESADRTRATLVVSAPGVRERKPEFVGFSASPDCGVTLQAGAEIVVRLRVYSFATPDIPGLLEKFLTVRKAVTGPNRPRHLLPQSQVIKFMTERIDARWYADSARPFYRPENADWISFGWIGGLMNTYPMLVLGDAEHLARVTKTFDFASQAQGKSGYYYGCIDAAGKPFGREAYDDHPELVLTRKNADLLFWLLKQFELLKAQGRAAAIKPQWEQSARRLAEAFVRTWQTCGQWGNHLNVETGAVAIYNSTSGAQAPGGLALAAAYFKNPEYRAIAEASANYYFVRDVVQQGQTTGHSADTMQNADADSAYALAQSLMALYETTGEPAWLEKSRQACNLFATWTASHDYQLPKTTELGQLDAKLAGTVWASTQNKHGAPGECTSSGDTLFKIYRATGDRRYAELLRDIIHAHAEGIKPDGKITERLTYCDADSRGSRGAASDSTGWCELNGILMAMELPGIYVRTDQDAIYVFDHVTAKVLKRDQDGVTLKITNPTKFDALVTVCAEDAPQAQRPLGITGFRQWPKFAVKSGATTQISVKRTAP